MVTTATTTIKGNRNRRFLGFGLGLLLGILLSANQAWANGIGMQIPGEDASNSAGAKTGKTEVLPVLPYENEAVVLLYHHISPEPEGGSSITPTQFKEHMEYLKRSGFNVIPISSLCRFLDGKASLPPKAVVITFDDGYESFYQYAFPVLQAYKFPATMFVIVADVGLVPPGGKTRHMSWEQMRKLQASGLVTFGSHTYDQHKYVTVNKTGAKKPALVGRIYNHATSARETAFDYENRIRTDLVLSKKLLEENLGKTVDTFAFPYGAWNPTALSIAEGTGFKYLFGLKKGVVEKTCGIEVLKRINGGSPKISVPLLASSIGGEVTESMAATPRIQKPAEFDGTAKKMARNKPVKNNGHRT